MDVEAVSQHAPECIPNIGPRERRFRLTWGIGIYAVAIGVGAWLFATGKPWLWRTTLFVPLLVGGEGVFQAFEKT